ncbi:MAG TPA: response regulator [Thermodesulfobacteriota bacterium]|nr:response regulator [Thermodesulfobacteriota bacterium]
MLKKWIKVLIVEDEKIVALDLRERLENLGYTVTAIASSLDEALGKIKDTRPDIVLLDIRLDHNTDGIKIAEQIRMHFRIPFIYMTAYADEGTFEAAKKTAPYGYILKPFEDKEIHTSIQIVIHKYNMEKKIREETENSLAAILGGAETILEEGNQKHDRETLQRIRLIINAASKINETIEKL